ncbi:tRNA1(Val) (adenine(37)-N6)-methyltransferase [Endozoicomonas sp. ONNA2]|uniref:tRNA1(Val) (adenine(37)-N6)-methyltransferase n=1 Tax=Endozoicomonas sp. ONNA2 TaxID=2828741 RepID=UPI00214788DC|nr:methyltransferase [Endozoicomonas sp. ONNA2]
MKITTDACILGALLAESSALQQSQSVLDIGTGTGLLSLMAAQNCNGKITAVELDEAASQQAVSNFVASPWADQFRLVNSAIQIFSATSQQRFDCVISNPPFFQQSFKGDDQRRNMARHTDSLSFTDLARAISRHLASTGEAWILLPVTATQHFLAATAPQGLALIKQIGLRSSSRHPNHRHILVLKHLTLDKLHITQEDTVTTYTQPPHYTEATRQLLSPYYQAL